TDFWSCLVVLLSFRATCSAAICTFSLHDALPISRPRTRWVRAMTFTASLAWQHLRDDPARLPLLALRLMPGPLRRAVRAAATRAGGTARAYALWDQGQRAKARETVLLAARSEERGVGRGA